MKVPDRILIIGNNESAIMSANKLLQKSSKGDVEVIVLGNDRKLEFIDSNIFLSTSSLNHNNTSKNADFLLRPDVRFLQDDPMILNINEKSVSTRKGAIIKYDYLILADPFESDTSSIKGYNEDARSVETAQKALSLREDLKKIISGDIVIYHCTNSSFTSTFAASLAVNIKSYISRKESADKLNVKFISSENSVVTDRITEDLIASTLEKNGIQFVKGFKLSSINVKNRELESEGGESIKYDLPVIFPPHKYRQYIEKSKIPRSDSGNIEVNAKTLTVKGHNDIYTVGFIGSDYKNNWNTLYNQVDFITSRIAENSSSYPEVENYTYTYNDILVTGDERAATISYKGDSITVGTESRTDYLIKLYGYQAFFGIYVQGFL